MNSEQEILARTVEELRRKSTELHNQMRSVEVALANRNDNVEQVVDEYTDYLHKLGLYPTVPPPLPHADIRIETNFPTPHPREQIKCVATGQGVDVRNDIKIVIDSVADYKRREHQSLEDDLVNLEQELDEVTLETEKILEEFREIDRRTGSLLDEAESIRTVSAALSFFVSQFC